MRRLAPRSLATALRELTGSLAPASALALVQERWPAAVGPTIAAEASPTFEREGVLTVTCSAAVWAQELELMGPVLLERLNRELGGQTISELRFRVG